MSRSPRAWSNIVIRASAGTGKTHQLSNRYLQLIADGQSPDQILASTFARKAAGEILGRVLTRLADAALDEKACRKLAKDIDRDLDRKTCHELLRRLTSNLHRMQIGTLDSFFVQLTGGFTLDLGLPTGWQILDELDDRLLRLEAIRRLLQAGSSTELSTLIHLLFKGEATRSITQQIAGLADGLYEVFRSSDQPAWHGLSRPAAVTADELERSLEALATWASSNNGWEKVVQADIERIRLEDWPKFLSTGVAAKLAAGEDTYSRKQIEPELELLYEPLLRHARGVIVGRIVNQTEATFKLLFAFGEQYEQLKHSRRGLRFDDVPRMLVAGFDSGLLKHAQWRIDSAIGHLLLDEFQDTSLSQWHALQPFARSCCEELSNRSFFCVGDVKQAIYRWRGGMSQIFDAVETELPGIQTESLATSHRSCQVVIDTVNRVFDNLINNQALANYPQVTRHWNEWFQTHSTAKRELAGHAVMRVAPRAPEGIKQATTTLEFAAVRIAELAKQCPGRSIGVLVRRNDVVARLIYLLRSVHQVLASEEGGNPLTDSAAVQLVLSLVKLADHPGDRAARFHVANSPLAKAVGFQDYADGLTAQQLAATLRRRFLDEGYGRTIYDWIKPLAPLCDKRDLRRLVQLVELGYAFEQRAGIRPSEFVAFVEQTRVEDPLAALVRVMTVHQAKGLQFDVVVLPELDTRLKGIPPQVAIGRPQPFAAIERICRHVNQDILPLLPVEYQRMFEIWPREAVNESLCVLYVAMTRAIHAIEMIVAPNNPKEQTFPQTYAGVVRSALTDGKPLVPDCIAYEHGDSQWFRHDGEQAISVPLQAAPIKLKLRDASGKSREMERRRPSGMEGGTTIRLGEYLRGERDALGRGSLWHAWLEQVEWLDDAEPNDERLQSIAHRTAHGLDVASEIQAFCRLLAQAEIRQALCRSAYADPRQLGFSASTAKALANTPHKLQLYRERRFAVRDNDEIVNGSIDRLVLWMNDKGKALAADLIDFKTDRISDPAGLDARVAFYRPQIEAYRTALGKLYGLSPAQIMGRLFFLKLGVVRSVFE